ncbi:MAG: glycosyltransferase family 39 protein [Candidatus Aenigmarchaeota archaeon]|nr:glycosyltransferase family 39 protein [Candidatus Aenigmarchaeota archaeon]
MKLFPWRKSAPGTPPAAAAEPLQKRFPRLVARHYYLILILAIMLIAFWIRAQPAKYNELPGLDEFLFYRYSQYAIDHNLQLPEIDFMRHHPDGINVTQNEYIAPIYIPIFLYLLVSLVLSMHYFTFVLFYPPIMGALACLAMFFLGREVYDNRAGLLAALFLAAQPAVIARTIAGIIEKEAAIAPFSVLVLLFFIRAFKRRSVIDGAIAGLCLAVIGMSSGIAQYYFVVLALFALVLLLLNKHVDHLMAAYLPTMLVALVLPALLVKHSTSILSTELASVSFTLAITGLVLIRFLVGRFKVVKPEQLKYVAPGLIGVVFLAFMLSTLFLDQPATLLNGIINIITLQQRDPTGFTVAENQPGSWGAILDSSTTRFAAVPWLSPYLSGWLFMFLALFVGLLKAMGWIRPAMKSTTVRGLFFLIWAAAVLLLVNAAVDATTIMALAVVGAIIAGYAAVRNPHTSIMLLLIIWLASSMLAVLFQIRLLSLYGPAAALLGGVGLAYLINAALRYRPTQATLATVARHLPLAILVFVAVLVYANAASGFAYTAGQGTSICFANPAILIDGQKCLEIDDQGKITYAAGQPWYDAFTFMSTQTPVDSNFLSWWDFGYWFQTRGLRPSVSDGGGGYRDQIAEWFVADASDWQASEPFLVARSVDYILMDYTLPGKYGAITAIASGGSVIKGIPEFQQNTHFEQGGQTIVEFTSGPYAIWLPTQGSAVVGAPIFLQRAGESYAQIGYVNNLCTESGILQVGNQTQTIGGCVAITPLGVHYLEPDIMNTIFARVMFMAGSGLPLERVYDSDLIQIYRVIYSANVTASSSADAV